jgi:hypothetical protein
VTPNLFSRWANGEGCVSCCLNWKHTSTKLRKSSSAPWRFAKYGRGSVQGPDSTEPRASASGQRLYACFRNWALEELYREIEPWI